MSSSVPVGGVSPSALATPPAAGAAVVLERGEYDGECGLSVEEQERLLSAVPFGAEDVLCSGSGRSHYPHEDVAKKVRIRRLKIVSMGDPGVGKSCLIKRYCEDRFVDAYVSTIGVDFGVKPIRIGSEDVRVNFWDLAGHEDYFEIRNEFYKDAQGGILVFDVCSRASFDGLEGWMEEARRHGVRRNIVYCLCGNKADCVGDADPKVGGRPRARQVEAAEARAWAKAKGIPYFETSANTGMQVMDLFNVLFTKVYTAATARKAAPGQARGGELGGDSIVSEPVGRVPARPKDFTREPS